MESGFSPQMLRSAGLIRRRAFEGVQDECLKRAASGSTVSCPDINDPAAGRAYMHSAATGAVMPIATTGSVLSEADLDDFQLGLLRWYKRVGQCPATLDGVRPGFAALCMSTIGTDGEEGGMQQLLKRLPPPYQPTSSWTLKQLIDSAQGKPRR